ncbi:MAG TPA: glycosyl hydrolase, partial [Gemmatimonadales bacterium]
MKTVLTELAGRATLALAGLSLLAPPAAAQEARMSVPEAIKSLKWRAIGPANMGGRVSAIEGVPGNPLIFWVGGADGGVFRTTNGGITFEAQFTDQPVYSVGALTLAPSDHNVLWLGSGEGDPRNSASYGNGVYRSTDGGARWKYLGLDGTERIKRIAVHPSDPDVGYVCALGHAWGPNAERGVFRTRDGGATWAKVLYRNEDTGCSDIAMDVSNPRILYAGMWTFRRRPWRFDDGGGETALYKSTDAGDTWTKLTNGLPKGAMARLGVAVSRSQPNVVYLVTETVKEGTLFRSDDAGESWRMVNDNRNINFRPFYYSDLRVDPNNPNAVYSLSGGLFKSIDGGRNFQSIGGGVHGDHQALWIDPTNSDRVLSGSDGGYQVSNDGGRNWDIINNVELSQFYHIAYDNQRPYFVCGGLQDNGSWCGPSATTSSAGILKDDWFSVSGGDGFFAVPVPDQPHLVYSDLQGGVFFLTDLRTNRTRRIHPYPNTIGSVGDAMLGHKYRFNWDSPIEVSPHDPGGGTVYIGGNVVF